MRRNGKTPLSYAWYVDRNGQIRSEQLKAGCTHPYIEYDANKHIDGFDHGRHRWRITAEARDLPNPPLSLLDAYKQDCRPEFSREIEATVQGRKGTYPWGFVTYMRWVAAVERGAKRYTEQDQEAPGVEYADDNPNMKHRRVPSHFPFDARPEISIRRIKKMDTEHFDFPEFSAIDFSGVDHAEAAAEDFQGAGRSTGEDRGGDAGSSGTPPKGGAPGNGKRAPKRAASKSK